MRLAAILTLLAACASTSSTKDKEADSKYVEIHADDGRVFYALRSETVEVDKYGMFHFENQVTHRRARLKRSNCMIRGVSNAKVRRARMGALAYAEPEGY